MFLANWLLEHNPNKPRLAVPQSLLQQHKQQVQAARQAAAAAAKPQQHGQCRTSSSFGRLQAETAGKGSNSMDMSSLQNAAATKVQSAFRGYKARKHVAEMRHAAAPGVIS